MVSLNDQPGLGSVSREFGPRSAETTVGTVSEVAANDTQSTTYTVTGANTDDNVHVTLEDTSKLVVRGYVSAANTVTVVFLNPTAGAITPTSASTIGFTLFRRK